MRRLVSVAAVAAVVAGVGIWAVRRRRGRAAAVTGAAPGRVGSWINAYLDGPLHSAVARALDPRADDDLLDVACGAGYFLTRWASHVGQVSGIDLSGPKVDLARRRLADRIAAGTAQVVQGDAGALPWADGRFSAVTCIDAFPLLPDPGRALAEMARVLRPGGRAVIETGGAPEGTGSHQARGLAGRFWAWDDGDVRRMVEAAGFDDIQLRRFPVAGDHRNANALLRRFGHDQDTLVVARKPTATLSTEVAAPEEQTAVF
jgi:SAM-dependent methyltransferase